jgi:hypothetical protein
MRLLRFGLLLGLVCGCHPQTPTFSSDVTVVTPMASVRNRDGGIVKDLGKDDFRLEEDGHRQAIKYFSRESDLSLVIGLLVDTSRSMQTCSSRSAWPATAFWSRCCGRTATSRR